MRTPRKANVLGQRLAYVAGIENEMGRVHMKYEQRAIGEGKKLSFLLRFVLSHTKSLTRPQPSLSCLYSLIIY